MQSSLHIVSKLHGFSPCTKFSLYLLTQACEYKIVQTAWCIIIFRIQIILLYRKLLNLIKKRIVTAKYASVCLSSAHRLILLDIFAYIFNSESNLYIEKFWCFIVTCMILIQSHCILNSSSDRYRGWLRLPENQTREHGGSRRNRSPGERCAERTSSQSQTSQHVVFQHSTSPFRDSSARFISKSNAWTWRVNTQIILCQHCLVPVGCEGREIILLCLNAVRRLVFTVFHLEARPVSVVCLSAMCSLGKCWPTNFCVIVWLIKRTVTG